MQWIGQASLPNRVNEVPLSEVELITTSLHGNRWHGHFKGTPVIVLQDIARAK